MSWLFQFIVSFILLYISLVSSYKVFIKVNLAKVVTNLFYMEIFIKCFILLKIHLFIFCYVRLFYISCVYLYRGWLIENVRYVMEKNPEYNDILSPVLDYLENISQSLCESLMEWKESGISRLTEAVIIILSV